MDSWSRAVTVGDGAVNFTAAHLWLDLLNASNPSTRWDSSPPAGGSGLDEQQRLVREQAYRDFTTTIQVFILIGSLLGKSAQTHTAHLDRFNYTILQTHCVHLYIFSQNNNVLLNLCRNTWCMSVHPKKAYGRKNLKDCHSHEIPLPYQWLNAFHLWPFQILKNVAERIFGDLELNQWEQFFCSHSAFKSSVSDSCKQCVPSAFSPLTAIV